MKLNLDKLSVSELNILVDYCEKQSRDYYDCAKSVVEEEAGAKEEYEKYYRLSGIYMTVGDHVKAELDRRIIELYKGLDKSKEAYNPYFDEEDLLATNANDI